MNSLISWSRPLWLLVAFVPACGGGDGSGTGGAGVSTSELVATCKKTCSKEKECLGAQGNVLNCDSICSPDNIHKGMSSDAQETCDYPKMRDKLESCLKVECKDLEACMDEASSICSDKPKAGGDQTGAGGAPSTSGGDTMGAGGRIPWTGPASTGGTPSTSGGDTTSKGGAAAGSDDCSVCERANACCKALLGQFGGGDASSCDSFSKAQCESTPAAGRSQFIQICTQTLQGGASANVAACQ